MPDAVRLALTTFTVARVRGPAGVDRRTAGHAMALAPLVGVLLGAVAGVVLELGHRRGADLLGAALAVAALAALTRGLHLDGLADTVDGLASYRPPEGALAVMRSPEVGPLGVAALVLVLLTDVAALASCAAAGRGPASLVVAVTAGRLAVTLACTPRTPAASAAGLGATVAGTVAVLLAAAVAAAVLVAAVVVGVLVPRVPVALPVIAVAAALAVGAVLLRHAVHRLGGISGDVLGALLEVTTAAALVVLALG